MRVLGAEEAGSQPGLPQIRGFDKLQVSSVPVNVSNIPLGRYLRYLAMVVALY